MMLVVIGILIARVLPVFNSVYTELGSSFTGLPRHCFHFLSLPEISCLLFSALPDLRAGAILLKEPFFPLGFFLNRRLRENLQNRVCRRALSGLDVDDSPRNGHESWRMQSAVREKNRKNPAILQGMGFRNCRKNGNFPGLQTGWWISA